MNIKLMYWSAFHPFEKKLRNPIQQCVQRAIKYPGDLEATGKNRYDRERTKIHILLLTN